MRQDGKDFNVWITFVLMKNKVIAVHDGGFHTDDVFAVAILKMVCPDSEVVRTRNVDRLKSADFRVDVGRRYGFDSGDFDHHQNDFAEKRENGYPYASAGLIWKHFGRELVDEDVWKIIDEEIIQFVDAEDSGVDSFEFDVVKPYTVADFVYSFNPLLSEMSDEKNYDAFMEAVNSVMGLLKREIRKAEDFVRAKRIILEKLSDCDRGYVVIEEQIPCNDILADVPDIKLAVRYNKLEDTWAVKAVKKRNGSFENKLDLPREWGGLLGEEFSKVVGIGDGIFCHKDLFLAIVKSRESAIKLAEMALAKSEEI